MKVVKELIETAGGAENLQKLVTSLGGLVQKYGKDGLGELISAFG